MLHDEVMTSLEQYPGFFVYCVDEGDAFHADGMRPGWYWDTSDSEPNGPFASEEEAICDAYGIDDVD